MITRDQLNGMKQEDLQEFLSNEITAHKAMMEAEDLNTLTLDEEQIIEAINKYEEYLKGVCYELGNKKDPETNETIKFRDVAEKILAFLDRLEVEWQYTMGYAQLADFWANTKVNEVIPYGTFDTTIRTLGMLKYKGRQDWADIEFVNSYLRQIHEFYSRDMIYSVYLASLHNNIMDQMKKLEDAHAVPVSDCDRCSNECSCGGKCCHEDGCCCSGGCM